MTLKKKTIINCIKTIFNDNYCMTLKKIKINCIFL